MKTLLVTVSLVFGGMVGSTTLAPIARQVQARTDLERTFQANVWRAGVMLEHGSGWILNVEGDAPVTYIVTAYHVVRGSPQQRVTFWDQDPYSPHKTWEANGLVAYFDELEDIALISVQGRVAGRGLDIAAKRPGIRSRVYGCGVIFNGPYGPEMPYSMVLGYVTGYGEYRHEDEYWGEREKHDTLETSCGIFYGFSGGAFIDADSGNVVGLVQLKAAKRSNHTMGLPCDRIRSFVTRMGLRVG